MTTKEAVNWIINVRADIGKIEHQELWHYEQALSEIMDVLEDAAPVVHGRWVHHPEIGWGSTWLCSECGEKTVETVMGEPRYKFCPMCGADMRKGGDHHEG